MDPVFRIGHQDQVDVGDMGRGVIEKGRQLFSGGTSVQDLGHQRDAGDRMEAELSRLLSSARRSLRRVRYNSARQRKGRWNRIQ